MEEITISSDHSLGEYLEDFEELSPAKAKHGKSVKGAAAVAGIDKDKQAGDNESEEDSIGDSDEFDKNTWKRSDFSTKFPRMDVLASMLSPETTFANPEADRTESLNRDSLTAAILPQPVIESAGATSSQPVMRHRSASVLIAETIAALSRSASHSKYSSTPIVEANAQDDDDDYGDDFHDSPLWKSPDLKKGPSFLNRGNSDFSSSVSGDSVELSSPNTKSALSLNVEQALRGVASRAREVVAEKNLSKFPESSKPISPVAVMNSTQNLAIVENSANPSNDPLLAVIEMKNLSMATSPHSQEDKCVDVQSKLPESSAHLTLSLEQSTLAESFVPANIIHYKNLIRIASVAASNTNVITYDKYIAAGPKNVTMKRDIVKETNRPKSSPLRRIKSVNVVGVQSSPLPMKESHRLTKEQEQLRSSMASQKITESLGRAPSPSETAIRKNASPEIQSLLKALELLKRNASDAIQLAVDGDEYWQSELHAQHGKALASLKKKHTKELKSLNQKFESVDINPAVLAVLSSDTDANRALESTGKTAVKVVKPLSAKRRTDEEKAKADQIVNAYEFHHYQRYRIMRHKLLAKQEVETEHLQAAIRDPLKRLDKMRDEIISSINDCLRRMTRAVDHCIRLDEANKMAFTPLATLRLRKGTDQTFVIYRHSLRTIAQHCRDIHKYYAGAESRAGPFQASITEKAARLDSSVLYPVAVLANDPQKAPTITGQSLSRVVSAGKVRSSQPSPAGDGNLAILSPHESCRPASAPLGRRKQTSVITAQELREMDDSMLRRHGASSRLLSGRLDRRSNHNSPLQRWNAICQDAYRISSMNHNNIECEESPKEIRSIRSNEQLQGNNLGDTTERDFKPSDLADNENSAMNHNDFSDDFIVDDNADASNDDNSEQSFGEAAVRESSSRRLAESENDVNGRAKRSSKKKKKKKMKRKRLKAIYKPTLPIQRCLLCGLEFEGPGKTIPSTNSFDKRKQQQFSVRGRGKLVEAQLLDGQLSQLADIDGRAQHSDGKEFCSWVCVKRWVHSYHPFQFRYTCDRLIDLEAGYVVEL